VGTEDGSWETTDADGHRFVHGTTLTLLRKQSSG
jgi:hypothetical protein